MMSGLVGELCLVAQECSPNVYFYINEILIHVYILDVWLFFFSSETVKLFYFTEKRRNF